MSPRTGPAGHSSWTTPVKLTSLVLILLLAAPGVADEVAESPPDPANLDHSGAPDATPYDDGLPFPASQFVIQYAIEHPDHPAIQDLMEMGIILGYSSDGFVAPRDDYRKVTVKLADAPTYLTKVWYASAIHVINEHIVREFNRRGLVGVLVAPHEADIDPESSRDLRPPGTRALRIVILTGRLLEYRSFASGERFPEEERIDHPAHAKMLSGSPVQPGDLLHKRAIDEYVARLSRHPGRSVDTAVSTAGQPGGVYVDFLVAEDRPYNAYFQIGNTGTNSTSTLRQRFGLVHNQLTQRDDILKLDYITGDFDEVHAVFGSYELPILDKRLRLRIGGSYTEYDSADFGQFRTRFTGTQWEVATRLTATAFQYEDVFLDVIGGMRIRETTADNIARLGSGGPQVGIPGVTGDGDGFFVLPELGVTIDHAREGRTIHGTLINTWNAAGLAGTRKKDVRSLGRPGVNENNFSYLRWNVFASLYLEPLLDPEAYRDPDTPQTSTLAHEIYLATRGQYSWGNRLIPQNELVAGGYYSVRGYDESALAGDDVAIVRGEYRFHLPRVLKIRSSPIEIPWIGEFHFARQQVYDIPDWDLILRGFVDYARTEMNDTLPGEGGPEDLVGAGLGIELRFMETLVLNFDWGRALSTVPGVKDGNDRFHLLATLIY